MALNLSTFGTTAARLSRVSFGPGLLKVNAWPGGTPTVDIGYAKDARLAITRDKIELLQGVPQTFITQYARRESVVIGFKGLEWNLDQMSNALGTGRISGSPTNHFGFGGDIAFDFVQVEFQHQMPLGQTLTFRLWKAVGNGELNLALGDDFHEFDWSYTAVNAVTNWSGANLNSDEQLCAIDLLGAL